MLNRIFNTVLLAVISLIVISMLVSCQKESSTIGVIVVKDDSGQTVKEARVILHANPLKQALSEYQDEIDEDGEYDRDLDDLVEHEMDTIINPITGETTDIFQAKWTDDNGRAEFSFPLEKILNVSVLKTEGNKEHLGSAMISIENGKTITKVVKLLSY